MTSVKRRVELGLAVLDEHSPGWADLVDAESIEMMYADRCVLGLVYGSYGAGCRVLYGRGDGESPLEAEHGFNLCDEAESYAPLTVEWRRVVAERQAGLADWEPSRVQGSQHVEPALD